MSGHISFALYLIMEMIALAFVSQIPQCCQKASVLMDEKEKSIRIVSYMVSISVKKVLITLSFLAVYILLACRDHVGADYEAYANYFVRMGQGIILSNDRNWSLNGVAFWLICKVLSTLGFSYYLMFAVIGFITLYFFYKAIETLSNNWLFSLFLLFSLCIFYHSFNEIRQMAAVAIAMYSIRYLIEKDKTKFFITVFLGATFHITCLIVTPLWFVRKIHVNCKTIMLYFTAGIVFYFLFDWVLALSMYTYYGRMYVGYGAYAASFSMSTLLNMGVRLVMFVFCLLFYKKTIRRVPYVNVYYHIAALCTILQLGAVKFMIFGRLTMYFYVVYVFLIPEVVRTIKNHIAKSSYVLVNGALVLFFTMMHYVYFFAHGAEGGGYLYYNFISIL